MQRVCLWLVLAAMSIAGPPAIADSSQPTTSRILAGESVNLLGGPSPDGRLLSFVDSSSGDLAVYDLEQGRTRSITDNPAGAETFAYFSVFSRDSSQLAYAWFNEQGFYELRAVDLDGGAPRALYRNPEIRFVQPCDWSPDGSEILTLFFRRDNVSQIALVSSVDGSVRVLKTLSWFYPKKITFSPDGRFILYDSLVGRDEAARDIMLLDADGSRERKLIEHPANDIFPLWSPSGDVVVFASDRSGDMDLWSVAVDDGEAAGEPQRIARSFGRALPLGVTADGDYYYGLRAGRSDVMTGVFDQGRIKNPSVAGLRSVGRSTEPVWSRDGTRVAYLTQLGTENYGQESRGITVWTPSTRQETILTPRLAFISRVSWSPDDSRLLVSGSDGRGRSGLFAADPESGALDPLVRVHGGDPRGLEGAWIRDDAVAYVTADRSTVVRLDLEKRAEMTLFLAGRGSTIQLLQPSPSGSELVVGVGPTQTVRELLAIGADGSGRRPLMSTHEGSISAAEWAQDTLYVTVEESSGVTVWRLKPDQGTPTPRRTAIRAGAGGLRLSPDGKQAAYVKSDQRSEVWTLEGWLSATSTAPRPPPGAASETPPGGP